MKTIIIENETGLHARPCSMIANAVKDVSSDVYLVKDGERYNAKSIMSIMSMACTKGTEIGIDCEDEGVVALLSELIVSFND